MQASTQHEIKPVSGAPEASVERHQIGAGRYEVIPEFDDGTLNDFVPAEPVPVGSWRGALVSGHTAGRVDGRRFAYIFVVWAWCESEPIVRYWHRRRPDADIWCCDAARELGTV